MKCGKFNRTEERLNLLNHLKAKYGGSIEKVLSYKEEKEERLEELEHYRAYRLRLRTMEQSGRNLLPALKSKCHPCKKAAGSSQKELRQFPKDLNFLDVKFAVIFRRARRDPKALMICFLISMNRDSR